MFIAMCGRSRRDGAPLLRALLIAAGVLLVLAVAAGLCAKCKEHMACCGEDEDTEEEQEEAAQR